MDDFSLSSTQLIRTGFQQINHALNDAQRLHRCLDAVASRYTCAWSVVDILGYASNADNPDTAMRYVADIAEKLAEQKSDISTTFFTARSSEMSRLVALCGASDGLGHFLSSQPSLVTEVFQAAEPQQSFDVDESASYIEQVQDLRITYWKNLLHIAADDVASDYPLDVQPVISQRLSALIDDTLRAALKIAQYKVPQAAECRFAVFGMGKLGAQEINYVSDVDLVYLVDKTDDFHGDLTVVGTQIGSVLQAVCSAVIPGVSVPALWEIDTALRPEGKAGALVRTVQSARIYYEKWAENWEFQALLKARFIAGDMQVGADFLDMITPLVWSASARKNFVYDCRAMRTRVEEHIPLDHKDREIKLGKGGLRDVEFTVQMLQLVHGRTDETLRTKDTLTSLKHLAQGGYINRQQAENLSQDYRFLRVLEHRQQLWKMKRTHLFPQISSAHEDIFTRTRHMSERDIAENPDIVRLSRAVGLTAVQLVERFDAVRLQVRRLHMDIYYRPMLPHLSALSEDDIRLSDEAMRQRFESVGFADPDAAMVHVHALTSGISRASRINHILLPQILLWVGIGQNPDMGLMMWRRWVETIGSSGPYLGFVRDSPTALERLCHIFANSRYLSEALMKSSESTTWLGDDKSLQPRSHDSLATRTSVMLSRFADSQVEFSTLLRAMRRREIERVGLSWMSGVINSQEALRAMTRVYDALLDASLQWATTHLVKQGDYDEAPARMAVIAMGRFGGEEVNFSSDADVMLVYEAADGVSDNIARSFASSQADVIRSILTDLAGTEQKLDVDMDLRPEGKNGSLVRSFDSCREYYASWSQTWERQALLRARVAAGCQELGARFIAQIADPLRYSADGVTAEEAHSIHQLKARMEAERLPRGVRNDRHIKLGRGGLSDVEWTVQLLQLRYAAQWEDVRTTHTIDALDALEKHGVIRADDAQILRHSWQLCTDLRNASFLWSGRAQQADIIPDDYFDMGGLAVCLGHEAHRGLQFMDDVIGVMRKCRDVVNRLFYGRE